MRTLKKLLYVACTASLLTSCEETYNDKLFWPGELNQEYGAYIKPATLDLQRRKTCWKNCRFQNRRQ